MPLRDHGKKKPMSFGYRFIGCMLIWLMGVLFTPLLLLILGGHQTKNTYAVGIGVFFVMLKLWSVISISRDVSRG